MCGRFAQYSDLKSKFDLETEGTVSLQPNYNVCPGQLAKVILKTDKIILRAMKWGLVTGWSKDRKYDLINIRDDTLATKNTFFHELKNQRCLVPIDGFYEWKKNAGKKTPFYITSKSGEPLLLAGLWNTSDNSVEGSFADINYNFSIITTKANGLVGQIHDRMPVIVSENDYLEWLDIASFDKNKLLSILSPYSEENIVLYPVSPLVNNPRNNFKELLDRI